MPTFLYFAKKGINIPYELSLALAKAKIRLITEKELEKEEEAPSAILVLGGDGTLLRAVPYAYRFDLPILGVNLGKFGFLTKLTLSSAIELIENWGRTEPYFDEREVLEIAYQGKGFVALNEGAILKGPAGRIVKLIVSIEKNSIEEGVCEVLGDGLLVATPTGSTAYNLSAGGPIIHPQSQVFVITPICSFKIQIKPVVIPMDFTIKVELPSDEDEVHLLIDGHTNILISQGSRVEFKKGKKRIKLVRDPRRGFFLVLREKFGW